MTSSLGQLFVSELLTEEEIVPDFRRLTNQQRVYKTLFQKFGPMLATGVNFQETDEKLWNLFQSLEKTLYPWIHTSFKSSFDIAKSTNGAGIVFCVGDNHYAHAVSSIRALREVLNSQIPIEIFYIDEGDLSPANRQYFETKFTNVKTVDISKILDPKWTKLGGWAIKPFAMLASSFTEVILIDADVYFLRKPEELFSDPAYLKTGALFFYDRTILPNWTKGRDWLLSFLPSYSTQISRSRWWSLTSSHEQESGVVVINKSKSLLGLLSSCKMNAKKERDEVTYKHVHGDKETFWVGYEMTQTPYAFMKSYGAALGGLAREGDTKRVCGNQLHVGTDGRPFWWNGGLARDKNRHAEEYTEYTHFATGNNWEFTTNCIQETDHVYQTTPEEQRIVERFIQIDKVRKEEELMAKNGSVVNPK
ncbi:mannosyltransferase putative-domain-containing protein [Umbelopsis sp. AD052]|nr:mannosyltransferase putative-domain-containing protein [Umbelopsis sp. AD052]